MQIEEVLIVRNSGNLYGINTQDIEHILRVQEVTPVPFSAREICGLCSIEGSIVTVLNLAKLLLTEDEIALDDPEARLITVDINGMRYSLLTQEVVTNIILDQNNIEFIPDDQLRKDGVIAAYKHDGEIMQILDLTLLMKEIKVTEYTKRAIPDRFNGEVEANVGNDRSRRFLLFKMAQEQYAIEVSKIREVITIPESYTDIADSNEEIRGMITLRDELIVIIDLRKIYNLTASDEDRNRIIVVQSNDKVVGLLIDEILDIADFNLNEIDALPENFKDEKVSGVANFNDELISLVDLNIVNDLIEKEARIPNDKVSQENEVSDDDTTEVVTFFLDNKAYALYTNEVIEIIDNFDITLVPDLPDMVKGVTNIRGKVVPVISLYEKLELTDNDIPNRKLIVCYFNDTSVGVIVDMVQDVSNIPSSLFIDENESSYFSKMIKLEDKSVVLMLDLYSILDRTLQRGKI